MKSIWFLIRRAAMIVVIIPMLLAGMSLFPPTAQAEVQTITATGEYTMGEAETPFVAKERAAVQAMRAASEQASVYLESLTEVKNMQLTRDEIMVLTSAVLEVMDKKYTQRSIDTGGMYFTCTISARVDVSNVEKMKDRARDKQAVDSLKKVQEDYAKAQREIEDLKKQLTTAQNDADRKTVQAAVIRNEETFTAAQWFERGYDFDNRKDYDSAINAYTKAITIDPRYTFAYFNRGKSYKAKGQLDHAIADYDQAIVLNPIDAETYNNRGNAYQTRGQLDRAIADYDRAIALDPRLAYAYANRGSAYHNKGQLNQAITDYNQAIALNPRLAFAYFNRGNSYKAKGELDRALTDYDQAITLNPRYADAYTNRGTAYVVKGELDRAFADYNQAIALDPRLTQAYYNRGTAYVIKGQIDQAIADYDQVIVLNPHDAKFYTSRGVTYIAKGQIDRAFADFDQAIGLNPRDTNAYFFKALVYEQVAQKEEAVKSYRAFLQYAPPEYAEQIQHARQRIAALGG